MFSNATIPIRVDICPLQFQQQHRLLRTPWWFFGWSVGVCFEVAFGVLAAIEDNAGCVYKFVCGAGGSVFPWVLLTSHAAQVIILLPSLLLLFVIYR